MKLYNTPERAVQTVKPKDPPLVSVYTCGPTVYDYPHIGNWFTFIRYDLLIRVLKAGGYRPKWVLNITDVGHLVSDADEGEDKLEKGAKREGKTAQEIADFYAEYFLEGMRRLNFIEPDHVPRATDHIPEQIRFIKKLESQGLTYVIDDGVYYDTSKFPGYEDFARLNLTQQQTGGRVQANRQKRQPADFALWKFSPKDGKRAMEWDSPWGKGFPGWHLECSALILKYLGETIDIHAGGIDHIPVHHTNEIAQSKALTGKPLSRHWFHTNHILVDGRKISKSLGNGITLEDVEKQGFSLVALRLLALQSHYRTQQNFTWESLEAAQTSLQSFYGWSDLQFQGLTSKDLAVDYPLTFKKIVEALESDLAVPEAMSWLNGMVSRVEHLGIDSESIRRYAKEIDNYLGLDIARRQDVTSEQKKLINSREKARIAKDWQKSDELRLKLEQQGIGLNDTNQGPTWHRI